MSERVWHGKVLAMAIHPTIALSDEERNSRIADVLAAARAEASITVDINYTEDDFDDFREMISSDVLDAAVLTTDH